MPTNSPAPESGTIVTVRRASPLSITPLCWSTNEPVRPPTEPVKCSMATYPAEPGVAVMAEIISIFDAPTISPENSLRTTFGFSFSPSCSRNGGAASMFTSMGPRAVGMATSSVSYRWLRPPTLALGV